MNGAMFQGLLGKCENIVDMDAHDIRTHARNNTNISYPDVS
jgi:hypothetical protein